MSIKSLIFDVIAYRIFDNTVGQHIIWLADKVEKLQESERMMDWVCYEDDDYSLRVCERGNSKKENVEVQRNLIGKVCDPRYIHNPFYNEKRHKFGRFHYLFDKIKEYVPDNADKPLQKG